MEARKLLVGLLILPVAASCNLILGEHELYAERQSCDDDNDCDFKHGEVCDGYDGVCRDACEGDAIEPCGPLADCSSTYSNGTCDDDLGTPCDPENSGTCGSEECLDRDDERNLVLGYCTKGCNETKPCPDDDNGHSYVCLDQNCFLKAGS